MRARVLPTLATLVLGGSLLAGQTGQGPRSPLGPQSDGEEVARTAERVNQGFLGERATFMLILINAQGDRAERRFVLEVWEDIERGDQSRIDFEWPDSVRGTVLLTHARRTGVDDQWLYLPATKRSRRISAGQKNGSFMGSEFTYEDLTPPVASKYRHVRMADATVDGRACFVLERRPRTDGSGYSRQLIWLDKERLVPLAVQFYDRKDDLLKVAAYRDYRAFGPYQRAGLVRMENRQTKRVSELRAGARELGITPDARRFRSETLGQ
jgi:outer membrane lipoprotein-sorting protein